MHWLKNRGIWLAYYANFISQGQNYYIAPLLPVIIMAQGMSSELFSILMILTILPSVTSRLLTGWCLDHVGTKKGTLWAYGFLGISLSLYVFIGELPWQGICVVLLMQTLAQSAASTGVNTLMNSTVEEDHRAKVIGVAGILGFASMPLAQVVSLPLANHSYILWAGCISLLVFLGLVSIGKIEYQDQKNHSTKFSVRSWVTNRSQWKGSWSRYFDRETFHWSMTAFGSVVAHGAVSTLIPLYAIQTFEDERWATIIFYFFYFIGIGVSRLTSGSLADRKKFKLLYAISIPLVVVGLISLALLPNWMGMGLGGTLIGLGYPTQHLTAQKLAFQERTTGRGKITATYWSSYDVAMALGKALLFLASWIDFRWLWVGMIVFQLISICWLIRMKGKLN